MTLYSILEGIPTTLPDCEITGVTDNTKALEAGMIFVCIKGLHFDGHTAAAEMLEQGAVCVFGNKDIIESANGSPVLVAYWYRHDLERISERLHKLHIPFARLDKPEDIRRWNSGEYPVMLIHPASAGHGLNLQHGGSTIVWFSIPWSLELYTQTVDRLFRQGQKAGTVSVIHIVAKGTIDGRIVRALKDKDDTQTALIDAVKAVLA